MVCVTSMCFSFLFLAPTSLWTQPAARMGQASMRAYITAGCCSGHMHASKTFAASERLWQHLRLWQVMTVAKYL